MSPGLEIRERENALFARYGPASGEAVLADDDLRRISARVMFCSGTSDPYVAPAQARPWPPRSRPQCSARSPAATDPGSETLAGARHWSPGI